jgi:hypothetical protein
MHKDDFGVAVVDSFESMAEAEKMLKVYEKTFGLTRNSRFFIC